MQFYIKYRSLIKYSYLYRVRGGGGNLGVKQFKKKKSFVLIFKKCIKNLGVTQKLCPLMHFFKYLQLDALLLLLSQNCNPPEDTVQECSFFKMVTF